MRLRALAALAARTAALLSALGFAVVRGAGAAEAPPPAVTHHSVRLADGRVLAYTATAGFLTLRDARGAPTADVFYVAYAAGDRTRPVTFLSNGGPGSASLWLQLGGFGPRRLAMRAEAPLPAPGGALVDNPLTLLDVSDLVFVDPVGTGYSRAIAPSSERDFWGVDADIAAFAQFVGRWRAAAGRAQAPVYLLGESYGTFRSAGLADALERSGTRVAGVILLSSLLDYGDVFGIGAGENLPDAFAIPSEAAVAWYHRQLPHPAPTLEAAVDAAEAFARDVYVPQILRPQPLDADARAALAQRLHDIIGLDAASIARADARVSPTLFRRELLRERNAVAGRYDGRISGAAANARRGDRDPSFDPLAAVFTPAFSAYVRDDLAWRDAAAYRALPSGIVDAWNFRRSGFSGRLLAPSVIPDLRDALQRDAGLRVFAAAGYFDLATPFTTTAYELANVGRDPAVYARITQVVYPAGHMIYLTDAALRALHADLDRFYAAAPR